MCLDVKSSRFLVVTDIWFATEYINGEEYGHVFCIVVGLGEISNGNAYIFPNVSNVCEYKNKLMDIHKWSGRSGTAHSPFCERSLWIWCSSLSCQWKCDCCVMNLSKWGFVMTGILKLRHVPSSCFLSFRGEYVMKTRYSQFRYVCRCRCVAVLHYFRLCLSRSLRLHRQTADIVLCSALVTYLRYLSVTT